MYIPWSDPKSYSFATILLPLLSVANTDHHLRTYSFSLSPTTSNTSRYSAWTSSAPNGSCSSAEHSVSCFTLLTSADTLRTLCISSKTRPRRDNGRAETHEMSVRWRRCFCSLSVSFSRFWVAPRSSSIQYHARVNWDVLSSAAFALDSESLKLVQCAEEAEAEIVAAERTRAA